MQNEPAPPSLDLDQAIRGLARQEPAVAAAQLTAVAHRAITELNRLARDQAARRRGEAEWGAWAKLANAARAGVLQVAAVRDAVKGLPRATDGE